MARALDQLVTAPLWVAALIFLAQNFVMFAVSTAIGTWLYRARVDAAIQQPRAAVTRTEIALGFVSVFANTLVPLAGLMLYRAGRIGVSVDRAWFTVVAELVVFMLAMDAMMYALHRLAHVRVFAFIHELHHRFDNPTPISLFALNPIEATGFGALWIVLLAVHPFSIWVLVAYTILNLVFGLLGHAGVEPLPRAWARAPILRFVTTSTFHNQHHAARAYNFGFYTTIWDTLFGTLHPDYVREFERNADKFGRANK
jgi:lathosterol oxidase